MKLEVYDLNKMIKFAESHSGFNMLSIRDLYTDDGTNKKYKVLDNLIKRNDINSLVVYFDDIDPYRFYHGMEHISIKEKFRDGQKTPIFFNRQIASDIVNWVMGIWKKDNKNCNIKVHCWAGCSRSQAVAYWLNMYFNLIMDRNTEDYVANNALNVTEKVHFNCEVLRVLTSMFG